MCTRFRKTWLLCASWLLLGSSSFGVLATSAHASSPLARTARGRVIARTYMQPSTGGSLDARNGVGINVPAGAMQRPGYVTITASGGGVYDVHIAAPWHGSVTVTMPLRSARQYVLHKVGHIWVTESSVPGEATVTVTQLSSFLSSVGGFASKLGSKLCLTTNLVHLVECAAGHIDSKLKSWIESKLPHNCAVQLAEGGNPLAIAKAAVSGDCVGSAGENGYHVPASPPNPTTAPIAGSPANSGGPQGPPVNPPATAPPTESSPPPGATEGFFVEDSIYGGTWARTDPGDGTWHARSAPPANGAYWYPNGLGVAVSCSESVAPYATVVYGVHSTWSWWAHVTDDKWVPTVVFSTVWADGPLPGLPVC